MSQVNGDELTILLFVLDRIGKPPKNVDSGVNGNLSDSLLDAKCNTDPSRTGGQLDRFEHPR